jgi:hypothetical protein
MTVTGNANLGGVTSFTNTSNTFTYPVSLPNTFGYRNRFINGTMWLAQRYTANTVVAGTSVPTVNSGYPCVDRWFIYSTGANATATQVAGTGPIKNALQITGASGVTAIGVGQRIESTNCYDMAGTTATLSANISNSLLTTVTWTAYYATTADTFGTIGTPTKTQFATGTWTVNSTSTNYTAQVSIPSAATTGIEVIFTVGAQTSGTWNISNVQFESGIITTPQFDIRSLQTELSLASRYFQKSYDLTTSVGTVTAAGQVNWNWGVMTTYGCVTIPLPQRMRANTTVFTNYSPTVANTVGGNYWNGSATVAFTGSLAGFPGSQTLLTFQMDATSRSNMLFQWTAECEIP